MLPAQYGERLDSMQPVKTLVEAGLAVHFEGGKPDEPPMWRIERFVTRVARYATRSERANRANASGATQIERVWGKDQAIDRKIALRMVTLDAAYFIGEEKMLGSIEKGKYGDLVVLNGDFMAVPQDKIDEIEAVMTIVGGKIVFEGSSR
jgi:predicted amidohydrolase YtcJ